MSLLLPDTSLYVLGNLVEAAGVLIELALRCALWPGRAEEGGAILLGIIVRATAAVNGNGGLLLLLRPKQQQAVIICCHSGCAC